MGSDYGKTWQTYGEIRVTYPSSGDLPLGMESVAQRGPCEQRLVIKRSMDISGMNRGF